MKLPSPLPFLPGTSLSSPSFPFFAHTQKSFPGNESLIDGGLRIPRTRRRSPHPGPRLRHKSRRVNRTAFLLAGRSCRTTTRLRPVAIRRGCGHGDGDYGRGTHDHDCGAGGCGGAGGETRRGDGGACCWGCCFGLDGSKSVFSSIWVWEGKKRGRRTTVTVLNAVVTVTVTGAQVPLAAAPPAPAPALPLAAAPAAPDAPDDTAITVTYFVLVLVPVIVVVGPVSEATFSTPPAPEPPAGSVAYTVAVEVCLIVVVTTVVDEPDPSVYVRVVSDDGEAPSAPPAPDGLEPVLRGTLGVVIAGVETTPLFVAVAV